MPNILDVNVKCVSSLVHPTTYSMLDCQQFLSGTIDDMASVCVPMCVCVYVSLRKGNLSPTYPNHFETPQLQFYSPKN